MITGLHHVGIAVPDLDEAITLYRRNFGLVASQVEPPPGSNMRFALIRLSSGDIELLAPESDEAPIAKFLGKRGPGIHHLAFGVRDIRRAMASAAERDINPLTVEPQPGILGHQTCFFHPRDCLGVLIEYVEEGHFANT